MTLDATVKGTLANAYLTESEATAYLTSQRLYDTKWSAASVPDRERAIIWATFILDTTFDWFGHRYTREQALRWPRSGVVDLDGYWIDYETIPTLLKKATATLAAHLLIRDRSIEPAILALGVSEAKLGTMQVKVKERNAIQELVPDDVIKMLAPFGSPNGYAVGGDRVLPLDRS